MVLEGRLWQTTGRPSSYRSSSQTVKEKLEVIKRSCDISRDRYHLNIKLSPFEYLVLGSQVKNHVT